MKPPANNSVDLDQLGELPHSYGSDTIFLVAQEPHWLFTYWDIDISRHPGGKTFLRVYEGESTLESEIEVPFETRNWYIPVKNAGSQYSVEIGYNRGSTWKVIARSVSIQTPSDKLSDSEDFSYATIPLHLSFQKLMENIQTAIQSGETLIQALARLQKDGKLFAFGPDHFPDLTSDEQLVLEALLGKEMLDDLSSGAFSSEEIETRIRLHLEEKLSSGGASELLTKGQWGGSESSLFSALTALSSGETSSWGGQTLSSWSAAALSSWAAAALTSWTAGAQARSSWGGESLGSWSSAAKAPSSWGAEALGSWAAAAQARSSWSPEALASWNQAAQSSWSAGALSSWLQSTQSSWALAALSSWNQAALTSWAQAATSSWSGASETLSSFGQPRNFFMHVNAEVIFYGGTDPKAKVTIDGKPITLNSDGTFRYHFVFPDGTYEIPIVATSPDGVETRSAVLRFERDTAKQGKVDDTAQPPLDAPMGAGS